jgi:hypothetical protein
VVGADIQSLRIVDYRAIVTPGTPGTRTVGRR